MEERSVPLAKTSPAMWRCHLLEGREKSKKDTYMNNVGNKRAGYFLVLLIFFFGKLKPGNQETTLNLYIDIYIYVCMSCVESYVI